MLEEHYDGDEAWNNFVSYYTNIQSNLDQDTFRQLKRSMSNKEDFAVVIAGLFEKENVFTWIKSKPPALEGVSPIECLQQDHLIKRLRVVLMRITK
jgi:hypothetical protein